MFGYFVLIDKKNFLEKGKMMMMTMLLLIKLDGNGSCNILSTYYMPRTMLYMLSLI